MSDTAAARHRSSYVLFGLAAIAAAVSSIILLSGGFSIRIGGVRVSSHGALRPALFALLFAAIAYRRMPQWQRGTLAPRLTNGARRLVPWAAPVAAAIVLALCFVFGARAAGGSDSYGYVSQAQLWLTGNLHVHQDFVASVPWPDADRTFTPLGYRPAEHHTIVPTYAPGLPLLMAIFLKAAGNCGPFVVPPLGSVLLILLTAALGSYVSGHTTGALAALLTATSPTILLMSLWPMSDVPAAALWLMSLVAASRPASLTSSALSGIATGVAILIRPNLAPLAVFPGAIVAWRTTGQAARRRQCLLAFALACVPLIAVVGGLNHHLYGSFLTSGYGEASSIYSWQNLGPNLHRYPRWLWETQGAYVFVFLFALALPPGPKPESRTLRWILFAYIAAVFGCYVFYRPFDDWWYLRFVIPAMPAMFVLSIDAISHGTRRYGSIVHAIALIVCTTLSVAHAIGYGRQHAISRSAKENRSTPTSADTWAAKCRQERSRSPGSTAEAFACTRT